MTLRDDILARLVSDFGRQVLIDGDRVRVRLLRSNWEIWVERPNPKPAREIKDRDGDAYAIPVGLRIVNRRSGKDVRGFDTRYLHPWWVRRFVFDLAAAVAYIEREWDVMSGAFVAKMERQDEDEMHDEGVTQHDQA